MHFPQKTFKTIFHSFLPLPFFRGAYPQNEPCWGYQKFYKKGALQKRVVELQKRGDWEIFETVQFAWRKIITMFNLLKNIY